MNNQIGRGSNDSALHEVGVIFHNRMYRVVIEVNTAHKFIESFRDGMRFVQNAEFIVNFTTEEVLKKRIFERTLDFHTDSLIVTLHGQSLITMDDLINKEEDYGNVLHRDW